MNEQRNFRINQNQEREKAILKVVKRIGFPDHEQDEPKKKRKVAPDTGRSTVNRPDLIRKAEARIKEIDQERKSLQDPPPGATLEDFLAWSDERNRLSVDRFREKRKIELLNSKDSCLLPTRDEMKVEAPGQNIVGHFQNGIL